MSDIAKRQNIIIRQKLTNGDKCEFSKEINLDFTPDVVIVRYISYVAIADGAKAEILSSDATNPANTTYDYVVQRENTPSTIYCSLVNDYIGVIFDHPVQLMNPTYWTLNKPVQASYDFKIVGSNGNIDTVRDGNLFIHFEFVKYKTYHKNI